MQPNRPPRRGAFWLAFGLTAALGLTAGAGAAEARWREAAAGVEFVRIDAGCVRIGADAIGGFELDGSPIPPRTDELPRHEVCVGPFWLARTEVTVGQWRRLMADRQMRYPPKVRDDWPMVGVSYEDALEFLRRLSQQNPGERFRLPTEAEWEFACAPGEPEGAFDDRHGPRGQTLLETAHFREPVIDDRMQSPVAMLRANSYGLHDMLGNAWEWVTDAYAADGYSRHTRVNPRVDGPGHRRVLRGGSYKTDIYQTRCGARGWGFADERLPTVGFRVLRELR